MAKNKKLTRKQKILLVLLSVLVDVLCLALFMSAKASTTTGYCDNCGSTNVEFAGYSSIDAYKHYEMFNCLNNCGWSLTSIEVDHSTEYVTMEPYTKNQHEVKYFCYCGYEYRYTYMAHEFDWSFRRIDDFQHEVIKSCACGEVQSYIEYHDLNYGDNTCDCGQHYFVGDLDTRYICISCGDATRHYMYETNDTGHTDYRYCDLCDQIRFFSEDHQNTLAYVENNRDTHIMVKSCELCKNVTTTIEVHQLNNAECSLCDYELPSDYKYSLDEILIGDEKIYIAKTGINVFRDITTTYLLNDDGKFTLTGWCVMNEGVSYYKVQVATVSGISKTFILNNQMSDRLLNDAVKNNISESGLDIQNYDKNAYYKLEIDVSAFRNEEFILLLYAVNDLGQQANIASFRGIEFPVNEGESDVPGTSAPGTEPPVELDLTYDVNMDGALGKADIVLMEYFVTSSSYNEKFDFDKNGSLNLADYVHLLDYFTSVGIDVNLEEETTKPDVDFNDLTYDVNGDGKLDIEDVKFINGYVHSNSYHKKCDLNNDGFVNLSDYVLLCSYFTKIGIDVYVETETETETETDKDDSIFDVDLSALDLKKTAGVFMIVGLVVAIILLAQKTNRRRRR